MARATIRTSNIAQKIFNLQRLAVLTTALTRSPPDPSLIFPAMQDRVHQPYRKTLVSLSATFAMKQCDRCLHVQVPGLSRVLESMTPETQPGVLGICLSGAGPTILALATHNFDKIAENIISVFRDEGVQCRYLVLEIAKGGATVEAI